MTPRLLLATRNPGKVQEYTLLLRHAPFRLTTLDEEGIEVDVRETGHTLHENAQLKAVGYSVDDRFVVVADDSGLEVDALDGEPGLLSARYGGKNTDAERIALLLSRLQGVPWEKRLARFRCVIAIGANSRIVGLCEGECSGIIGLEPRGDKGFGYDPVFYLPEFDKTMAELSAEEKNLVSHRGKASQKALQILERMRQEISR
ncbi:MAG: non-canonical purine NTP pyrophosphatase, RdgB/HAM1 family [Chloroflexi bacterium RBG_13_53_26]|nr:MAG: non-canonical purine NTP pyrophosphatase, RdgB/HAM1 family [Chloroflexi bacterium RBG_13_53_26]